MKYLVDVKDISYGTVEVEAESKEQAEEMAQDMYHVSCRKNVILRAECAVIVINHLRAMVTQNLLFLSQHFQKHEPPHRSPTCRFHP